MYFFKSDHGLNDCAGVSLTVPPLLRVRISASTRAYHSLVQGQQQLQTSLQQKLLAGSALASHDGCSARAGSDATNKRDSNAVPKAPESPIPGIPARAPSQYDIVAGIKLCKIPLIWSIDCKCAGMSNTCPIRGDRLVSIKKRDALPEVMKLAGNNTSFLPTQLCCQRGISSHAVFACWQRKPTTARSETQPHRTCHARNPFWRTILSLG